MTTAHEDDQGQAGNFLDLCTPPDGTDFVGGLWLTHDLNIDMVADTVAPYLAKQADPDPVRRRRLAYELGGSTGDAVLSVLYAPSRLRGTAISTPSVRLHRVPSRLLHAKIAILQFRRPGQQTVITHAFVTSANLTRGGLHNRELLAWEKSSSRHRRPTLAAALLDAVDALVRESDTDGTLAARVAALRRGVRTEPLPCVVHNLNASRRLLAPSEVPSRPARRAVLVGPAFGGDSDDVAHLLAPWVGAGTVVEVYTGSGAEHGADHGSFKVRFSRGILRGIEAVTGAPPRVFGVPTHDAAMADRPLHAKALAFVDGDRATVFLGSANITSRGLGGTNRELVVRQEWPVEMLDRWLAELGAQPYEGETDPPSAREEPDEVPAPVVALSASFRPDHGQSVRRTPIRGRCQRRLKTERRPAGEN